jgi:hypothetical protein
MDEACDTLSHPPVSAMSMALNPHVQRGQPPGRRSQAPDQNVFRCTEQGDGLRVILGSARPRTAAKAQDREIDDGRQSLAENPCDQIIDPTT